MSFIWHERKIRLIFSRDSTATVTKEAVSRKTKALVILLNILNNPCLSLVDKDVLFPTLEIPFEFNKTATANTFVGNIIISWMMFRGSFFF